jgi:hypothetical protein
LQRTVVEEFPDSGMVAQYEKVAERMLAICEKGTQK